MKKLAITIAGAVSLGAYEAGVMYELLQALKTHNIGIDQRGGDADEKFIIDVVCGASAGALNIALIAQKLLFQPSRLEDASDNDLYLPWVRDVDLTGLLALSADENPQLSILSSDFVELI